MNNGFGMWSFGKCKQEQSSQPSKSSHKYTGSNLLKLSSMTTGLDLLTLLQVCLLRRSPWASRHGRPCRRSSPYFNSLCSQFLIKKPTFFFLILGVNNAGGFSVAFDPLDGSSIVDTNFTVGTIFGVWPGDKLTAVTGRDQVAAAMGIYGPRTTYVLALKGCPGTHEFLLLDEGYNKRPTKHNNITWNFFPPKIVTMIWQWKIMSSLFLFCSLVSFDWWLAL